MNKSEYHVLVLGNDDVYRRCLTKVLGKSRYNVSVAVNLTEALKAFSLESFSVVIVDMYKPGEGGLKSLQSLLNVATRAHVLVLTVFSEKPLIDRVLAMGAFDCLVKPVKRHSILAAVDRALQ